MTREETKEIRFFQEIWSSPSTERRLWKRCSKSSPAAWTEKSSVSLCCESCLAVVWDTSESNLNDFNINCGKVWTDWNQWGNQNHTNGLRISICGLVVLVCMCSFACSGSLSGQSVENYGCLHLLSGSCLYACLGFLEVIGQDSLGMQSDHMPSQLIRFPASSYPQNPNTSPKKVL